MPIAKFALRSPLSPPCILYETCCSFPHRSRAQLANSSSVSLSFNLSVNWRLVLFDSIRNRLYKRSSGNAHSAPFFPLPPLVDNIEEVCCSHRGLSATRVTVYIFSNITYLMLFHFVAVDNLFEFLPCDDITQSKFLHCLCVCECACMCVFMTDRGRPFY